MGTKLKPCPFCGGEARVWRGEDAYPYRFSIECASCKAHIGGDIKHLVNEAWNRRAGVE